MKYYVLENGETVGPIEAAELRRRLVGAGRPNPDLQVNPVGTPSWTRVAEVGEFEDLFIVQRPSPTPKKSAQTSWVGDKLRLVVSGVLVFVGSMLTLGLFASGSPWLAILLLAGGAYLLHKLSSSGGSSDKKKRSRTSKSQSITKRSAAPGVRFEVTVRNETGRRLDEDDFGGHGSEAAVQPSVNADQVWVPPGQPVLVHGLPIPGGMMYVGKGLGALAQYRGLEPSLVDPGLSVNLKKPDLAGKALDYWPSYHSIPPRSRAAYLLWLAGGRSDADAPLGYVFLFFYGLERRLLFDARSSAAAKNEVAALIQEVVRLRSIYGRSGSFERYSSSLLQACRVMHSTGVLGDGPPPVSSVGYELPVDLAAGLGERMVAEKPITAPWAFAWYMHHPETNLRTPAQRCASEFERLFLLRFAEKYPTGLKIKPNKRRLVCEHRTASAGLSGCRIELERLPDVRALSGPVKKFTAIADACNQELDAYSRYLGRNPGAEGSLQAYALLPAALAGTDEPAGARELGDWIKSKLLGNDRALVPARELMDRWEHSDPDKLSKKEAVALAHVLERLGVGLEPDPRFGGPALIADGHAAVFKLGSQPNATASREYGAATILLHLAAIVAAADGVVSEEEEIHLEQHLEEAMHLEEGEKVRLRAHLSWLLSEPPGTAGLKKRIESLSLPVKHQVAQFAVSVAGADGRIDPAEVTALQKLYKMMGLDPESVFSDIHGLTTEPATAPVTVGLGQSRASGRKIPAAPAGARAAAREQSFELNMDKVREKMRDTAEVASLLSGIFVEEEVALPETSARDKLREEVSALGLDAAHTQLLKSLKGASELNRQEFEQRCAGLDLLPDGALDALNEAAFECSDAPLLIGDDPIEVDADILEEMCT